MRTSFIIRSLIFNTSPQGNDFFHCLYWIIYSFLRICNITSATTYLLFNIFIDFFFFSRIWFGSSDWWQNIFFMLFTHIVLTILGVFHFIWFEIEWYRTQSHLWTLQLPVNQLHPVPPSFREPLENNVLDNHSQTKETLWRSRLPEKKFHHTTGAKNMRLDALDKIRGATWLYLHYPSSMETQF